MYQFSLVFQVLCIAGAMLLIVMVGKKQASRAQKYLLISAICAFLNCVCYYLELTAANAEAALVARKIQLLSLGFATMHATIFIYYYCRIRIPKIIYYILLSSVVVSSLTLFTDDVYHLHFSAIDFVNSSGFPHLIIKGGAMYLLPVITQMSEMAAVLIVTTYRICTCRKQDRRKYVPIYISALNSLGICALDHMGVFGDYYPRSFEFLLIVMISVLALYKNNLFRVVMAAKEMLVDYMDEALIILDYNKHFMDANRMAIALFPELKYASDGDEVTELLHYMEDLKENRLSTGVYTINGKHYKCSIHKIYEGDSHKGYTIQFIDITDERENSLRLMELTNQAEEANKAKSRFLANMSHEIRTPMNAIIGMSEITLRGDLDETQRKNIESILYSSTNLLSIINNILDLSRIESGKLELVNSDYHIESVLYNVYNICSMRLEERPIKFELTTASELPVGFYGDAQRVYEILINLLGNAIKYCSKGSIGLSVGGHYMDELNDGREQFLLEMAVSDTGVGIKQEDIDKIFDAYTRSDTSKNQNTVGTGLGLAIVKNYVRLMNGSVSVESVYGEGTTFYVSIPQVVKDKKPLGRTQITAEDLQLKKEGMYRKLKSTTVYDGAKVLVVDDVRVNLVVVMGLLKPYNIEIDTATSGAEAIEKVKANDYDIVFMDHMMPEMDGVEATQAIRNLEDTKKSQVKIIALTANAVAGTEEMFLENGFDGYLSKPIDIKKLEQQFEKWLNSNT